MKPKCAMFRITGIGRPQRRILLCAATIFICAGMLAMSAAPAFAAGDKRWVKTGGHGSPGNGNWTEDSSWNPALKPWTGDFVYIDNGSTVTSGSTDNRADSINLGSTTGTSGTISLTGGSLMTGLEYVGMNGTGSFSQTAGTHTTLSLYVGFASGSAGTYTQSGGTTNASTLWIGYVAGSSGTYNLTGGTLNVADLYGCGGSGTGVFNMSNAGTKLNVSGWWDFYVGQFNAGTDTNVTFTGTGDQKLSSGGTGNAFYTLWHTGTGTVTLYGQPLQVNNDLYNYGGTFSMGTNGDSMTVERYLVNGTPINQSTFDCGSGALSVGEALSNSGIFNGGSGGGTVGSWMTTGYGITNLGSGTWAITGSFYNDYEEVWTDAIPGHNESVWYDEQGYWDEENNWVVTQEAGYYDTWVDEVPGYFTDYYGTVNAESSTVSVAGNWHNDGFFDPGTGKVIFNGDTTMDGLSETTFNDIEITGTLTAPQDMPIGLTGDWQNSGTFNNNGGAVIFEGTGQQALDAGGIGVGKSFHDLLHGGDGTLSLTSDLKIDGGFENEAGTFAAGNHAIYVSGDWLNYSVFNAGQSTVYFNGADEQHLMTGGTGAGKAFYNLTHSGAGLLALDGYDLQVDGVFENAGGTFNTNGHRLITSGTFTVQSGAKLIANGTIMGTGGSAVLDLKSGAILSGTGTIVSLATTVEDGGIISPGNSPGTLTVNGGSLTLDSGSHFEWELYNAGSAAGTGWDLVRLLGGATLILDPAGGINFDIFGWDGSARGQPSVFDQLANYHWMVMSGVGGGIDITRFTLHDNIGASGSFAFGLDSGNLYLDYTGGGGQVPEPATVIGAFLAGAAALWRRKKSSGGR